MMTPTARLEARLQVQQCKLCAWLAALNDSDRKGWAQAIGNPRFGAPMIAQEIRLDGGDVSEGSVQNHRQKAHR